MGTYRIGRVFIVRSAGVPMDVLDELRTPEILAASRAVTVAEGELDVAIRSLRDALRASEVPADKRASVSRDLDCKRRVREVPGLASIAGAVERFHAALATVQQRRSDEAIADARERDALAARMVRSAERYLPGFAPFARAGMLEALDRLRTHRDDKPMRTVSQYLQRVAVKNDTISTYGPTAWGVVDPDANALTIEPGPIRARTVFFERWVLEGLARAIDDDDGTRVELAPRASRGIARDGARVTVLESGECFTLTERELAVLARCDGTTRGHAFSAEEQAILVSLAERGIVVWKCELPDLEPHGFEVLAADIAAWRLSLAKRRWTATFDALAALKARFADPTSDRLQTIADATKLLRGLKITAPDPGRALYVATNIFGEECVRSTRVVVGGDLAHRLGEQVAPFYDLWQDVHAYVSSEVARKLLAIAPLDEPLPLPVFLARCAAAGCELRRDGLPRLAGEAFARVKAAWTQYLAARAPAASRWTLGDDELAFVRRTFPARPVRDCAWPSIDVQIVAPSLEHVARGDYEVLVSELHGGDAMVNYGASWACADLDAYREMLARGTGGVPIAYYGQIGPRMTSHTTIQFGRFFPHQFVYLADRRTAPAWRALAAAQVTVHRGDDDIRLRGPDGEDLGTVTRTWASAAGAHPFAFAWGPHSPRLYTGDVIIQRETWTLRGAELPRASSTVAAIEALRAAKGLPRCIFVRPAGGALRRAGNTGKDKDVKPSFVDLESILGIEVLAHRLRKYDEIEVAEMLPPIDASPWIEDGARYSFELRMMVEPHA